MIPAVVVVNNVGNVVVVVSVEVDVAIVVEEVVIEEEVGISSRKNCVIQL